MAEARSGGASLAPLLSQTSTLGSYRAQPGLESAQQCRSSFKASRRKRALLIGICYRGETEKELVGCTNDIERIYDLLCEKFGFQNSDFVVMTDSEETLPPHMRGGKRPTRENMIAAMQDLVAGAQPGDSLFFLFCGHGDQVRDRNWDELDGKDETILPVDHLTNGQIIDDDLNKWLVFNMPKGARLTALFDCCHSGTVFDLPFIHQDRPGPKILLNARPGLCGRISRFAELMRLTRNFVRAVMWRSHETNPDAGEVFLFSGCRDDETAKEFLGPDSENDVSGALTACFIDAITNGTEEDWHKYTYRSLLENMQSKLNLSLDTLPTRNLRQTIQFSTSHFLDLETLFVI
jgi:metacaspase-1